ncbi:hypothetical protein PoB_003598200 [Plakobranchus ocellatus]|uniref:G-protein coupled receptors family 1 profile domain-containing protein n=1 Tax=Plakobranchus ocellatus TaxID=259542 RepID=A0AAV4ARB2_9GAST|nr:hypothetical protein PoB_003598200 [Plakobranchus ocellatus]
MVEKGHVFETFSPAMSEATEFHISLHPRTNLDGVGEAGAGGWLSHHNMTPGFIVECVELRLDYVPPPGERRELAAICDYLYYPRILLEPTVLMFGIPGNIGAFVAFLHMTPVRPITLLFAMLTMGDLCTLFASILPMEGYWFHDESEHHTYHWFHAVFALVSLYPHYILVLISIERATVTWRPFLPQRVVTLQMAKGGGVGLGFVCMIIIPFMAKESIYGKSGTHVYQREMVYVSSIVPGLIILVLNVITLIGMRRYTKEDDESLASQISLLLEATHAPPGLVQVESDHPPEQADHDRLATPDEKSPSVNITPYDSMFDYTDPDFNVNRTKDTECTDPGFNVDRTKDTEYTDPGFNVDRTKDTEYMVPGFNVDRTEDTEHTDPGFNVDRTEDTEYKDPSFNVEGTKDIEYTDPGFNVERTKETEYTDPDFNINRTEDTDHNFNVNRTEDKCEHYADGSLGVNINQNADRDVVIALTNDKSMLDAPTRTDTADTKTSKAKKFRAIQKPGCIFSTCVNPSNVRGSVDDECNRESWSSYVLPLKKEKRKFPKHGSLTRLSFLACLTYFLWVVPLSVVTVAYHIARGPDMESAVDNPLTMIRILGMYELFAWISMFNNSMKIYLYVLFSRRFRRRCSVLLAGKIKRLRSPQTPAGVPSTDSVLPTDISPSRETSVPLSGATTVPSLQPAMLSERETSNLPTFRSGILQSWLSSRIFAK